MADLTISFDIPQDLLATLKFGPRDLAREIRLLSAITYFQEKKLSLGKAGRTTGRCEPACCMDILARKGIVIFDYDESALESDMKGIRQLEDSSNDHQYGTKKESYRVLDLRRDPEKTKQSLETGQSG